MQVYTHARSLHSCPALCNTMDCSPPGSSVHGDSQGKKTGVDCHALPPGDLPNPGIKLESPACPALQAHSLPTEPPGKPMLPLKKIPHVTTKTQPDKQTDANGATRHCTRYQGIHQ